MKTFNIDKESKAALRVLAIIVTFMWISSNACAQEKGVSFNVQGDFVSSYVWRGMYQSGAAVQPTLGLSAGGFSLTAWGSVDFNGEGKKEADLTATYSIAGLTVSLTDYWWAGQAYSRGEGYTNNNKYFNFDNHTTDHILEAGLSYTLPYEKLPLSISYYTMLWGYDNKANGKQAYSAYAEVGYPFSVKGVDLNAAVGFSPYESAQYGNNGFAMTNISLKATKAIRFTDSFSLPIFAQTIWSPNKEDVHFVFGFTLRP